MFRTMSDRIYHNLKSCAYLAGGLLAMQTAGALDAGAQGVPSATATSGAAGIAAYWTPERMKSAVSLDAVASGTPTKSSAGRAPQGTSKSHEGSPPSLEVGDKLMKQLFVPDGGKETDSGPAPTNFGTAGFYFTTGRLSPPNAARVYPNRAAGKFFFSDTVHGGDFVCSASAIKFRVVVTAGHCVAHGSAVAGTRHFYSNMLYVPAYANGAAPYGSWPWAYATTTNNWFLSGSVPNLQDVGMIEVSDQVIGGVLRRLGNVTGWLGWWTLGGRQLLNHVTQLGYPCNLDSCQLEQINNAGGVRIVSNNLEIGSAMQGGSSGGPWIQDYGVFPVGGPAFTAGNWVLGVTSYQYLGTPSPAVLGASIFQNAGFAGHGFGDLWNAVCAHRAGNC
jgi:V8-like Glu-specific endopeptidase